MKRVTTPAFKKIAQVKPRPPRFRVERLAVGVGSYQFKAYSGKDQVGQAFVQQHRPGEFTLDAIDIFDHSEDGGPNYQKQGFGTKLMSYIAKWLKDIGAKHMSSSNEGSGTVQLLDRAFGRPNVQHFHGGKEIDYEKAKHIMDVQFGYTGSKAHLQPRPPTPPEEELA